MSLDVEEQVRLLKPETINGEDYYTLAQIALIKRVSLPTVYNKINEGALRASVILGKRVVCVKDIPETW